MNDTLYMRCDFLLLMDKCGGQYELLQLCYVMENILNTSYNATPLTHIDLCDSESRAMKNYYFKIEFKLLYCFCAIVVFILYVIIGLQP